MTVGRRLGHEAHGPTERLSATDPAWTKVQIVIDEGPVFAKPLA